MIEKPKDRYISIDKLRLHYLEWGDATSRPMILLHGTGDNAHIWDHLASHGLEHFRIVALDQRGHGDSDWAIPPAYTCKDYLGDLSKIIEALQLTGVVLAGHSMGALHAAKYASTNPDRVKGLVYTDIEPCPPPWNKRYLYKLYGALPDFYCSIEDFVDQIRKTSPYAQVEMLFYLASWSLKKETDRKFFYKVDREVFNNFDEYDLRAHLAEIRCPTLIIRGKESRVMRRQIAKEMSGMIRKSRFIEIPNATHPVHTDNPQRFQRAILDFLKDYNLLKK